MLPTVEGLVLIWNPSIRLFAVHPI